MKLKTPYMTIDRKLNHLPYTPQNCCSACFACNRLKGNLLSFDQMRQVAQTAIKPQWERHEEQVLDELSREELFDPTEAC
jgi:hypothetical protein